MTPVDQTRYDPPDGNCMAACVASILNKPIEEVDVDVANCNSVDALLAKIEEKAGCKIYRLAIVDGVVKSTERYCIASLRTNPNSIPHSVVCEIAENGKLSLVFNPNKYDQRRSLRHFAAPRTLFIVKPD
jgi:hypothetical protein